jgi:HSP20 family molecular chaperone IbpA
MNYGRVNFRDEVVKQTDTGWEIRVELPGLDSIKAELAEDILTVEWEKEGTKKDLQYFITERLGIDKEKIDVVYKKGVVVISLPRAEKKKREIKVKLIE